jgi:hypothetical protein
MSMPINGPLAPSGISSDFSKDHDTYFSQVKLSPEKTIQMFYDHVNNGMKNLSSLVKADRIRLKIVAVTFGAADVMIVWQAKDADAAKQFRDSILAGDGHKTETLCSRIGDGHDG